MRLLSLHRALIAAVLTMALLPCGIALGAPSAVGLHEPDLPGAATVWCLGNPEPFATSARAVGLDIGTRDDNEFDRPGDREITLKEWSVSPDLEDIEDFDAACRPAFEAFSPSGRIEGSGTSLDESVLTTLLGVGVGALAAGGTSVGLERWRSNQKDADELRRLSGELREAVARYIPEGSTGGELERARTAALALRDALGEWEAVAPENAKKADIVLAEILDPKKKPRIGDLGSDRQAGGKELMGQVSDIRTHAAKVAEKVGRLRR